jgi:uncharacterized RDD family membrane protein YckC
VGVVAGWLPVWRRREPRRYAHRVAERSTSSHTTPGSGEPGATAAIPASIGRRFGALLIDWLLCLLVARLFADPVTEGWAPVSVLILEYTFFVGFFGQTPGMRLLRLRCLGSGTGRPVGPIRALLRAVLLALVVPALIMDAERRGLHDRAVGTIVTGPPPPAT